MIYVLDKSVNTVVEHHKVIFIHSWLTLADVWVPENGLCFLLILRWWELLDRYHLYTLPITIGVSIVILNLMPDWLVVRSFDDVEKDSRLHLVHLKVMTGEVESLSDPFLKSRWRLVFRIWLFERFWKSDWCHTTINVEVESVVSGCLRGSHLTFVAPSVCLKTEISVVFAQLTLSLFWIEWVYLLKW